MFPYQNAPFVPQCDMDGCGSPRADVDGLCSDGPRFRPSFKPFGPNGGDRGRAKRSAVRIGECMKIKDSCIIDEIKKCWFFTPGTGVYRGIGG